MNFEGVGCIFCGTVNKMPEPLKPAIDCRKCGKKVSIGGAKYVLPASVYFEMYPDEAKAYADLSAKYGVDFTKDTGDSGGSATAGLHPVLYIILFLIGAIIACAGVYAIFTSKTKTICRDSSGQYAPCK